MATKKKNLKKPEKATASAAPTGTAPAGQQAPHPDPTALSIGDLKNLSTILDVASTRGAFKASEMSGVGYIYNKLQAFLNKVTAEGQQAGTGAPTTTAPATAEGK